MLFNELNNVKIGKAGTYLTEEQKEKLWKELFLTTKKVTLSKFSKFLIKEGIDKEEAVEIKGLDGGFKSSLAPWIDLKNILGEDFTRDKAEEIIKAITLFSMDKKILKKYLMRIVSEPVAKQLSKLRYTGWGRFSKEFLTEITPRVTDDVQVLVDTSTGEIMNIITALKKTSLNLMEILSSTYGYSAAISEANKELVGNTVLSYETVKELTVSPAVKRPIWQTLKIIKEITHIMGAEPARIFIEMARDKQPDKGRTDSRKKQLIELYKKCKEDVRSWSNRESKDWVEEIESKQPYTVEKAVVDNNKINTSNKKVLLMGMLLGLVASIGGLFIQFMLNDKVRSADDIEKLLGVPVLAGIGENKELAKSNGGRKHHETR